MKCKSRTEYDCFYLDSNNVDEFLIWIDEHFVDNYYYMIYDEFIQYNLDINTIITDGMYIKMDNYLIMLLSIF